MKRLMLAVLLTVSCASTGGHAQFPLAEMPSQSGGRVIVHMDEGTGSPFCMLPDAGDDINCYFQFDWLQNGALLGQGTDGYKLLDGPSARQACNVGMFGPAFTYYDREACAQALLFFRFAVDGDGDGAPGDNPEEP